MPNNTDTNDEHESIANHDHHHLPPLIDDLDRDRGLLTPADRRYLVGVKKYEHKTGQLNRSQKIRERVYNGLLDLALAYEFRERYEYERIAEFPETEQEYSALDTGMMSGVALICLLAPRGPFIEYADTIEQGVESAYRNEHRKEVDAELTITELSINIDRIAESLDSGQINELDDEERIWLAEVVAQSDFSGDDLRTTVESLSRESLARRATENSTQ